MRKPKKDPPYAIRLTKDQRELLGAAAGRLYQGKAQPLATFIRYAACTYAQQLLQLDGSAGDVLARIQNGASAQEQLPLLPLFAQRDPDDYGSRRLFAPPAAARTTPALERKRSTRAGKSKGGGR